MLKDQDGPESDIGSLVEQERRMKREEKGLILHKNWECFGNSEMHEVVANAIRVLEQEPCEDVVSRKAIDQNIYDYAESNGLSYANMKNYILDVPPVTPTQRWIPVSERLPEVGEKVLCQCQANIYEVLKLTVDGWYHDQNHCYMESFVIAWMPLPEPYKADNKTEQGLAYADQDAMMSAT